MMTRRGLILSGAAGLLAGAVSRRAFAAPLARAAAKMTAAPLRNKDFILTSKTGMTGEERRLARAS